MSLHTINPYRGQTRAVSAEDIAEIQRELREDGFASGVLMDLLPKGAIDLELVHSVLSGREARLAQFCKLLGVELDTAIQREERYASLRSANTRIRELERQLGQSVDVAHIKAALGVLREALRAWWAREGFGHVQQLTFEPSGATAVFSCMLSTYRFDSRLVRTGTRAEAFKAWLQDLKSRGFDLFQDSAGSDAEVLDTENNRTLLRQLIRQHLPSAVITRVVGRNCDSLDMTALWEIEVHIGDLADLKALTVESGADER